MSENKPKQSKELISGKGVISNSARNVRWIISIILILYTCITFFVVGATLLNSLKTKSDLITNFVSLPKAITFDNFKIVLFKNNFLLYFKNSIILTVCGTAGSILLSAMAAYGISRYEFKGRGFLKNYFLIGIMVPIQVSVLPLFIILRTIGLLNTLLGMILVYMSGISMSCLIFQKFFATIPKALEESARLDGGHDVIIFFCIIVPICKPVIFTMTLITAIGHWNDFYMPMIILGNKNVKTLTLVIYQYIGQFTRYMSESFAAVVITLIPIIIIYFLFSSQIVEGLTGGAVKG
jgi:raffinose/stachyose/melibiose transport system permease protein